MSLEILSILPRDDAKEPPKKEVSPEAPTKEEILSDEYLNGKIEEVKYLGPLAVVEMEQAIKLYKDGVQNLSRMEGADPKLVVRVMDFARKSFMSNVENIKKNLPGKLEPKITTPEVVPESTPESSPAPASAEPTLTEEELAQIKKDFGRTDEEKQKEEEKQEREKVIDSSHMFGILSSLARTFEVDFIQRVLKGQLENNPGDEKMERLYAAYKTIAILGPEYIKEQVISDIQIELDKKRRAIEDKYRKALKDGEGESTPIAEAQLAFEEDVKELKAWMNNTLKSL